MIHTLYVVAQNNMYVATRDFVSQNVTNASDGY